jgi:hypothetical protein
MYYSHADMVLGLSLTLNGSRQPGQDRRTTATTTSIFKGRINTTGAHPVFVQTS